jgi:prepilin-type N-terminal cleavage/methylation domain-containing protein
MASHKTSIAKSFMRGFTLIEVLIVVSLITMIAGLTLFFDVSSFRRTAFNAELATLAVALQTARADALNNIDQLPHGVKIYPGSYRGYVVFEGADYSHRDTTKDVSIPSMYTVAVAPSSPDEVVFKQLSGEASTTNYTLALFDTNRNASGTVLMNTEGLIDW